MKKIIIAGLSIKDILFSSIPVLIVVAVALFVGYKKLDPAPPTHLVITTGDGEGDYLYYAEQYRDIFKEEGVTLEIRKSTGPVENLRLLEDEDGDVDVGFSQDGLGSSDDQPDLVSLGSLYYEPLWVFYRTGAGGSAGSRSGEIKRFSQLQGKKIAVGHAGQGTHLLALNLLRESGVNEHDAHLVNLSGPESAAALKAGRVDAAFFILSPDDEMIADLARTPGIHIMNVEQAEAISRRMPSLHHLVFPQGVIDMKKNIPDHDINLVSPTATLLVRDDLHPALVYLLLKAASEVHGEPGIFEKKGEFPINKDDQFPLSPDARQFYKSGGPFWQRYLPFWIAAWVDRFFFLVIPFLAVMVPLVKMIPRIYKWRIRQRIYRRYGELKFLEAKVKPGFSVEESPEILASLDEIEESVNEMRVPLEFTEHIYSLRGHIHFVRERLRSANLRKARQTSN